MYIREEVGGTWGDPGEHGCGEDAQSIWDMAKLRDCMVPRPCQELNPMQVLSVSRDLCPDEVRPGEPSCQKL